MQWHPQLCSNLYKASYAFPFLCRTCSCAADIAATFSCACVELKSSHGFSHFPASSLSGRSMILRISLCSMAQISSIGKSFSSSPKGFSISPPIASKPSSVKDANNVTGTADVRHDQLSFLRGQGMCALRTGSPFVPGHQLEWQR